MPEPPGRVIAALGHRCQSLESVNGCYWGVDARVWALEIAYNVLIINDLIALKALVGLMCDPTSAAERTLMSCQRLIGSPCCIAATGLLPWSSLGEDTESIPPARLQH
jgi:hypothetical protein